MSLEVLGCLWKPKKKEHIKVEGGGVWGDVIAGPNVFMAAVKRPETPIKATNTQRKQQTGDRAACPSLLLRAAA